VGPLSGFLTRNWTLKISALGLALLLWISVRVEAPNRQELSGVPVRVDLADPGWALTDPPSPATVQVRFGGPSRELLRMAMDRPTLVIPMDQVASGDTTVILRNQWVRVQDRAGVVVEDIQPPMVRLVLEPIERIALPPAIRLEGELPPGLALSAPPLPAPGEIRVSGPRARVLAMDSVPLLPVNLSTIQGSGAVQVEVAPADLDGLQFQPLSVEVEFRVEDRVERVVSGIPIFLWAEDGQGAPEGLAVLPATAAVRLSGARSLVERVDPTGLRLVVDSNGRNWPEPGDEEFFPLRVDGVPALVRGAAEPGQAGVRRPEPQEDPGDPEGPGESGRNGGREGNGSPPVPAGSGPGQG
jgi:YbbR domain-containing protein